jgi:uncharacterized protein (DUF305 family)
MQNKYTPQIYNLLFLLAGLLIGFLVWHQYIPRYENGSLSSNRGTHMMGDGSMMADTTTADMSSVMTSMNADLQGKTGDSFDRAFLSEMIIHHQGAIDMAKLAQTNAAHQEIKDLAGNIITAQTKEIAQMKVWQKSWYSR